jgi:heme-degrading monooxygenase HmoA
MHDGAPCARYDRREGDTPVNQVQEMLRLSSPDRADEAVRRLSHLFATMAQQPGFLSAEVLRSLPDPELLLVLHAWRDLSDWQRFQTSEWKVRFSAKRPESLYSFVPCGMNWRSLQTDGERVRALLRREVIEGELPALRTGERIRGCQTFAYQDGEPEYAGCYLRLTRLATATAGSDTPHVRARVDEVFESLTSVEKAGALSARTAGS